MQRVGAIEVVLMSFILDTECGEWEVPSFFIQYNIVDNYAPQEMHISVGTAITEAPVRMSHLEFYI